MNLVSTSKYRDCWTAEKVTVDGDFVSGALYFSGVNYSLPEPTDGHHHEKNFRVKLDGRKFKIGIGSSGAKIAFELPQ